MRNTLRHAHIGSTFKTSPDQSDVWKVTFREGSKVHCINMTTGRTRVVSQDQKVTTWYHTLHRTEIIAGLRDMIVSANAADSDNPPELGGNDLPADAASGRDGLYYWIKGALNYMGQGPAHDQYIEQGEWPAID